MQQLSDVFVGNPATHGKLESTRNEARRLIRTQQQGLGNPIVSTASGQERVIAVGNQLFSSSRWKYFPDFLVDYSLGILGRIWAKEEFDKPFNKRHPFMQWYDLFLQFQNEQPKRSDGTYSAVATGAVNCFLGLSYSLYLLKHNVDLQDRLIARLRDVKQFQGAYYELIVANCLIRAGFELELEDESDPSTKHCEFSARSKLTNKKFWIEAKMRSVSGFLGKTGVDGATLMSKPTSRLTLHINDALEKPAEDERLIFVDVNADPADIGNSTLDDKKAPSWLTAAAKQLDMRERDLRDGDEAYVLVTNIAFHRVPSQDICRNACLAFGLGISDFSKPGYRRLSETWRHKQKHIDLHNIMESLQAYPKIPNSFDGSLQLSDEDRSNRLEIDGTYFFEEVGEQGMLGTVTTATVMEEQKKIYFGITTEDGKSQIRQRAMSETELRSYQLHPDAFFGVVQPVSKGNLSPFEMFEWLLETYRHTPREKLLEFLKKAPDYERLSELNDLDLALEYCERIASSMARQHPNSGPSSNKS